MQTIRMVRRQRQTLQGQKDKQQRQKYTLTARGSVIKGIAACALAGAKMNNFMSFLLLSVRNRHAVKA